jgi:hypothetical protein
MDSPLFADLALAQRICADAVRDTATYVRVTQRLLPERGAESVRIGDGVVNWVGPDSVLNGAFGFGMTGPVPDEDIDEFIEFFRGHDALPQMDVTPLGDGGLVRALGARGFVCAGFENVLYQPLGAAHLPTWDGPPDRDRDVVVSTRVIEPDERELWADLVARGFSDDAPSDADRETARIISQREDATLVLGLVDDEPAGTGLVSMRDRLASFNSDTTLPRFRGNGVQTAILRKRLFIAAAAGCDLAVIESEPGSPSQRNMERLGFRVAFTNVTLAALA